MIETSLIEQSSGKELYIAHQNGDKVLITQTHAQVAGRFKAKTLTDPGILNIITPDADGCIVLTDLMITTNSSKASTVSVIFTDDTETITIISGELTDAPLHIAIPFTGYWRGWRDARVDLVITGVIGTIATVACGYFKLHDSILYSEWDALR